MTLLVQGVSVPDSKLASAITEMWPLHRIAVALPPLQPRLLLGCASRKAPRPEVRC